MAKKKAAPKIKKDDPKDIVSEVVAQLKPEIKNHIENLRADILNDVKEMTKKNDIPAPKTSLDVNSLIGQLKDGNVDLSSLAGMLPGATAPAAAMPKDLDPSQQMEYLKMQQNNQLVLMLPQLLKLFMPQQNSFMNEMMGRMFAEQMSSVAINQRAQSMLVAKLAGSPELINQINQNYSALSKPIDQALDKQAVPNGQNPST